MKIALLGNTKLGYSWYVLNIRDGCRNLRHELHEIDFKSNTPEHIVKRLDSIKPEMLFTHLTFHTIQQHPVDRTLQIYRDLRKKHGTKVIHVLADARHEPRYNKSIHGAIDVAFLSQTQNLNKFQKYWNVPTYYWQYSSLSYKEMAAPVKDLMFNDPVFTGTLSHPDRTAYINALQKIMKIKIFQTQSKEDLRHRTSELSASAKCILGLCTGYDIDGYTDVRPWQYLGTGACMIMRKFKGMDKIIPDNLYYSINSYDNPQETLRHWKTIQKMDTSRMRREAFDFIQRHHSATRRMEDTLNVINGKRDKVRIFLEDLDGF